MKPIQEQLNIIKRGIVELIPENELVEKLKKGKPLKIKFGADPSAPDIHLGHTVVLNKLKQLQDLGHEIIFLIGDFTAMIGDPTGKSETRKALSKEEIEKNAKTYQDQVFKILDKSKTGVVYNSKWFKKMTFEDSIKLSSKYTVARMLERNDFEKRFKNEQSIAVHEFSYPLMQGYDSVVLDSDLEVGGTDQKFNMLVGRELQREYGKQPQVVLTMPILEGLDGIQKMSKSLGNYIGVTEEADKMFAKIMSISDELMVRYYELLTDVELEKIRVMHPMEAKKQLGRIIVARFHSEKDAQKAQEAFESLFSRKELPGDIPLKTFKERNLEIIRVLVDTGLASSNGEAKRLIKQNGVKIDEKVFSEEKGLLDLTSERVIQVGRRKFVRVKCE
ncbi:tyrosine--tRNA ligase [candidate division WOR-1 bacterium RIFOXYD2_FULL_36_8]|uniref:Tyrosine--tRNA ligase n=1 Tax=candidate division WOR-1 bacterium RIFOXYB2_FULL_36_35 TaxID=1802578 RepID=A0A1F4S6S4_UNCSA|nr:MAG: tyrosine--tRNA ligase [candidate division WOR-1 bacterium RIFOXYA2_FULL_36_21]OGC16146.1 MAG: tyrosine--tRNA ligase [candidate division WOR-1 bacterium RIFOXYB2_FULL_36_35]OGC16947.1 MAG: tyrosine--tRNA ligase [candidate division WOR-1 bacterium RIFOXYA12_FULL_36_13]OGC39650.1 MAG: tyrosine--tRNA ligase [candidate division WOR-1 bacterium RIFOXYD2_FULL_36_8]